MRFELSRGRDHLPRVAQHHARPAMRAHCILTLTLATCREGLLDSHLFVDSAFRNVAQHRPRCAIPTRRSESSAEATEKAETAPHRVRAPFSGSTLGTPERCQRPHDRPAPPTCVLLLVLDAPSTRAEGKVVVNVVVTHIRFRNTCNVNRFPVHLGLDPARESAYVRSSQLKCAIYMSLQMIKPVTMISF